MASTLRANAEALTEPQAAGGGLVLARREGHFWNDGIKPRPTASSRQPSIATASRAALRSSTTQLNAASTRVFGSSCQQGAPCTSRRDRRRLLSHLEVTYQTTL